VEEEAEIVRLIYRLFLYGKSASFIASLLTDECIPTPGGKKTWRSNVVISILRNEKYAGNAMLQKGFTTDFLTKKTKLNEGELPQFFLERQPSGHRRARAVRACANRVPTPRGQRASECEHPSAVRQNLLRRLRCSFWPTRVA